MRFHLSAFACFRRRSHLVVASCLCFRSFPRARISHLLRMESEQKLSELLPACAPPAAAAGDDDEDEDGYVSAEDEDFAPDDKDFEDDPDDFATLVPEDNLTAEALRGALAAGGAGGKVCACAIVCVSALLYVCRVPAFVPSALLRLPLQPHSFVVPSPPCLVRSLLSSSPVI